MTFRRKKKKKKKNMLGTTAYKCKSLVDSTRSRLGQKYPITWGCVGLGIEIERRERERDREIEIERESLG